MYILLGLQGLILKMHILVGIQSTLEVSLWEKTLLTT